LTASLIVKDLSVDYIVNEKAVRVLNKINLRLNKGEITGVVGESGSGKSTLALTLIGLLPENARVTSGEVLLEDKTVANAQFFCV
jgi:ATPase components of various ABC-type transport systems, contain duplicated ATPase